MAPSESATPTTPIVLKDLIALNDEIVSLVRAGVPLEVGLSGTGSDVSSRLKPLAESLALRVNRGESLSEALEAEGDRFPKVYRAVVEAGLKVGRLPEALEAMSVFSRSLLELRKQMLLALLYPSVVLLASYALFVLFIVLMVPRIEETYRMFDFEGQASMQVFGFLAENVWYWGPTLPAIFVIVVSISQLRCRPDSVQGQMQWGLAWIPWMRGVVANFRRANFSQLLAILVEHETPIPEALMLASNATGDKQMIADATRISEQVRKGQDFSASLEEARWFPPFMAWMIRTGARDGSLAASLRQVNELYRHRALFQAEWLKLILPPAFIAAVGGGAVFVLGLTLFLPMGEIVRSLTL